MIPVLTQLFRNMLFDLHILVSFHYQCLNSLHFGCVGYFV
jgi:hypothetical protein